MRDYDRLSTLDGNARRTVHYRTRRAVLCADDSRGRRMNSEKHAAAVKYLKDRGIYLLDNKFKPTNAASTDVAKTIARYPAQTTGKQIVRVAK